MTSGKDVDPALAAQLRALHVEMEQRRLGIFREHLARRVCLASPLLLDACREGELDEAVWRLRPSASWPDVLRARVTVRGWSARRGSYGPMRVALDSREGVEVSDMLVLTLGARAAHMALRVGETVIHTSDRGGRLMLPGLMPLDRREDLIFMWLERAFAHPILIGRQYRIQSAVLDAPRLRTILEFTAAPSEWRVPWARPWVLHATG